MRRLAVALVLLAGAPASGLAPDSTAAPVPEAGGIEPVPGALPADSLRADSAALPRPAVAPFGAAPGRPLTPVPALTAALDPQALLADVPGAFVYRLGAPGRIGGVAFPGSSPHAPSLRLDGRPLDDVFTGAPRLDLLPAAATGPVRAVGPEAGRAAGLSAGVRPFRLDLPVTEMRYLTGQEGVQHVSATHAQTRRPPGWLRGGSDDARLTATGHVATRRSNGLFPGGTVRHLDALARFLLTRPGLAAEAGVLHADRTEGARTGVTASTFGGLFTPAALVGDASATRRTLRTEAWTRARIPLAAQPLEAGASYGTQRLVHVRAAGDTLRAHADRAAAFARQPLRLGDHALAVRLDAVWTGDPHEGADVFGDPGARLDLGATLTDSLRLGGVGLVAEAGLHRVASATIPAAALHAEAGPAFVRATYGGRARSFVEAAGVEGRILPDARDPAERTLRAEAGLDLRTSTFRLGARAFGSVRTDAREIVSQGDSLFRVVSTPEAVRQVGLAAGLGWREAAPRGLYLRAEGTVQAVADPSRSALHAGLDRALPRAWGTARLGVRAVDVGEGVLDLDLSAVVSGWSAFRSRLVEPTTGLLALPEAGTPLGQPVPARATLGLEATATFSARASLFLRYDNALAERAYNGALVTLGEPLPAHALRFGVFWALVN
ncbi:MAG: hypothetical protein AAF845_18995 [Bacteroidota bacterium]